jgi:hypothetical protein
VRRAAAAAAAALGALAAAPAPAHAHGLAGRSDLPIPEWLFAWAAAIVLVVSFALLAAMWTRPKLADDRWRPLPWGLARRLASRPVDIAAGALGAALLAFVLWAAVAGEDSATGNLAPTAVYVAFWLGLVPANLLLGDVYHALNPWRAIARAAVAAYERSTGRDARLLYTYPDRLGYWPAVAVLVAFGALELAAPDGDRPRVLAVAIVVFSELTFLGMALYGIEAWTRSGDGFAVYFRLLSRLAPVARAARRDRDPGAAHGPPGGRAGRRARRGRVRDVRHGHVRRGVGRVALAADGRSPRA